MSHERTATELYLERQDGISRMKLALMKMRDEEQRRRLSRPVVVAMGFHDYDILKSEILVSSAELVPNTGDGVYSDVIRGLNSLGVECFFFQGMLITRINSSACCGPFFL